MRRIVLDASVAIKWYVPEIHSNEAEHLLFLRESGLLGFHVPDLFLIETANILWKKARAGELNTQELNQISDAIWFSPKTVHASRSLLSSARDISQTLSIAVYDSLYLALAIALDCPLVTADRKLYQALFNTALEPFAWWIGSRLDEQIRAKTRVR